jgi:hypothetical protein
MQLVKRAGRLFYGTITVRSRNGKLRNLRKLLQTRQLYVLYLIIKTTPPSHCVTQLSVGASKSDTKRLDFALELPKPAQDANSVVQFTIKFKNEFMSEWKWVRDQFGLTDGYVYLQPESFEKFDLSYFISDMGTDIDVQRESSQTPETLLWSLTAPLEAAEGQASAFCTHKLGSPTNLTRWFALCRLYSPWILPKHGKNKFEVDKDAILVAFLRDDGLSVVALAMSGIDDTASCFKHDEHGNVIIHSRNDADSKGICTVYVAVAASFDVANASVMYHARKVSMELMEKSGEIPRELEIQTEEDEVKPNWYEEWYDGFGYCTWNSLGQDLTEQKILEILEGLHDNDITCKPCLPCSGNLVSDNRHSDNTHH